jgi:hypothetical protein
MTKDFDEAIRKQVKNGRLSENSGKLHCCRGI